ncbi:hypothetical protein [Rhodoferax mekongensis]|uniref:hypothetical protein n=1 Tax=Rhodoferax mekongensis TaxID=3068341 RepID=UPI0028BE8F49|nr:hypothetical protein [Rhodoferax sp. TBRC 17199]MDT7517121.1 hypothetical protein [Rhodoferax sp. TBRC 17199]
MSKKETPKKYADAIPYDAIAKIELKTLQIRCAKRKPKTKKVEPVIPTVVRCLRLGKSSRAISSIVKAHHGISVSKDTILRFAKTLPNRSLNTY